MVQASGCPRTFYTPIDMGGLVISGLPETPIDGTYAAPAEWVSSNYSPTSHVHAGGDHDLSAHSDVSSNMVATHGQALVFDSAGGDLWTASTIAVGGGTTHHGSLTGLGDDDHAQYFLGDGSRAVSGPFQVSTPANANSLLVNGTTGDITLGGDLGVSIIQYNGPSNHLTIKNSAGGGNLWLAEAGQSHYLNIQQNQALIVRDYLSGEIFRISSNGMGIGAGAVTERFEVSTTGSPSSLVVEDSTGETQVKGVVVNNLVPIGTMMMYCASTTPTDYLICSGQPLDTTDFADLHTVLGYNYGGAGASFNLPDMRQRFPMGMDVGTSDVGASGGASGVAITTNEMPSHQHAIDVIDTNYGVIAESATVGDAITSSPLGEGSGTVQLDTGNSSAFVGGNANLNILPKFVTINYIIKYQ